MSVFPALSLVAIVTWLVLGFCVGFGWAAGHWLCGKILR